MLSAFTASRSLGGRNTPATPSRLALCSALLALLIVLAGCASSSSSSGASPAPPTTSSQPTPALTPPANNTPSSTPTTNSSDWTMYHRDNARTGYVPNAPDPRQLTRAWGTQLDGPVYAEPLVIGGRVIVATDGDSLYALDASTGQVQWRTNVGTPVPLSTLPCGNIDPLGITGTPVYDPGTKLVFAVAEISGPAHILVGVDANTGQVRLRRSLAPSGMDPRVQQQRAALALWQGMVYIAFGGLYGDCGDYYGWVIGARTDGQGSLLIYRVPTTREGGIWAPPGPVIDTGGHLYVSVGNGAATGGNWDHSDSVLKLSPTLQLLDAFAPDQWAQDNAGDADLGSMSPALLPGGYIFASGKSGLGYLLHANALGGVGGQVQVMPVCSAYGGAAVLNSVAIVPCVDGLREVQLNSGGHFTLGWHAQVSGSPVIGGHSVYSLDRGGTLYALSVDQGAVIATLSVGATSRFATPTLSANHLFIGTLTGVVAVTIS